MQANMPPDSKLTLDSSMKEDETAPQLEDVTNTNEMADAVEVDPPNNSDDTSNAEDEDQLPSSDETVAIEKDDLINDELSNEHAVAPLRTAFPISSNKSMCGFSLDKDVENVDLFLYRTCRYVIVSWFLLIAASYWAAPKDTLVRLKGTEKNAALIELCVLTTAVIMRHGPSLWDMKREMGGTPRRISGVLAGGLTVQFIAISTVAWMVYFPVPVMIDPVFKSRVHLLRWCEWTPLAGFMTLLMQCIDAPTIGEEGEWSSDCKKKMLTASLESFSTFCGILFPFCPNLTCWILCMVVSFATYFHIFYSYAQKAREFQGGVKGRNEDHIELHERARLSLALHWMCCFTWTLITGKCFYISLYYLLECFC
jgi:hypothetical protein